MIIEEARKIAIIDYLAYLDIYPVCETNGKCSFFCPFEKNSLIPSFEVDLARNQWHDFFIDMKGDLISFGTRFHNCSLFDFLQKLDDFSLSLLPEGRLDKLTGKNQRQPGIRIISVEPISSPELIQFLKAKKIVLELANNYFHELEIEFPLIGNRLKVLGLPNESGGFQLRALNFKGSTSSDVSFIDNDACSLVVIDDLLDCLVAMQGNPDLPFPTNWLVLNGQGMNAKVDEIMLLHDEVYLLLGNDKDTSGIRKRALSLASGNSIKITDLAPLDHNFNTISEWVFNNTQNVRSAPVSKNSREDHRPRGFRR
ncbi:hypothetical protein [Arachidicoccus terrestris]|uniref:hypothetical protein n=1 Tax=Arachidicoccus terrestris TaxID=2875539 RepID=UPI001CC56AF6|nr:hypothetical protein [Arachidicoccus terrestris]UAY56659.1 hypothetical protein K9M52_06575 [Arachidicoccus terrestris]